MTKNKMVEWVYNHPEIDRLISKVQPMHIRDDLRQELCITLLSYPFEKISEIWASNGLLWFSIKIISNMSFSSTSAFYKTYKQINTTKLIDYQRNLSLPDLIDVSLYDQAADHLSKKYSLNKQHAHEAILFNKYVELRSYKKVADFYNIPYKHVNNVILKTKKELKKCLQPS